MQHADLAVTPFNGLGFELSSVSQALPFLKLRKIEPVLEPFMSWVGEDVFHAWGYDLLLLLNQETCGS